MNNIRLIGNVKIIDKQYVEKEEKDLTDLYSYLISRGFTSFVPLISYNDNISRYQYIEDLSVDNNQLADDLIKTISLLHNKTSYNKSVALETYKSIYENINGYVNYLDKYYTNLLTNIEMHEFSSPSEILFLDNYYKIPEVVSFLHEELNKWYNMVKDKHKQRVSLNHGKLELSHLIKNNQTYLISLGNANFSSPINDIIRFYKKEWNNIEFSSILDTYLNNTKLSEDELKLLLINLVIPFTIENKNNEYKNTIEVSNLFNYIYKTEELIRPYYSSENSK